MQVDDPRRMIEAYRARAVPDARAKAVLLERLLATEPLPVRSDARRWALLVGITVALAAALLLVLAGIGGALGLRAEVPAREQAVHGSAAAPDPEPTHAPAQPPVPANRVADPSPAPAAPQVESPRPHARPSGKPGPAAPVDPPATSTLVEEGRLLARAQAALRDGDPRRALAELDEHARRFPSGGMAVERDALQIIATCEAGDREPTRARAFVARSDAATYAARIRRACEL